MENQENEVEETTEFVSVKIAKDLDERLTSMNKESKIPKQWILDRILRNFFYNDKKTKENYEVERGAF